MPLLSLIIFGLDVPILVGHWVGLGFHYAERQTRACLANALAELVAIRNTFGVLPLT